MSVGRRTRSRSWGREDEPDAARERLLDAAGEVFAERGVAAVTMSEVAAAAGCSRGTLYRYFPDAAALRLGFVEREAARVGALVAGQLASLEDPAALLVEGCVRAVAEVRADPVLAAWFEPGAVGVTSEAAAQAVAVERSVGEFVDLLVERGAARGLLRPGLDRELAADWVVRAILSLLTRPARPRGRHRTVAAAERDLLRQMLVPALFTT